MAKKKTAEAAKRFPKATEKDFAVLLEPVITEKTMTLMQNENKVTMKVLKGATKTEIRLAFERIFQVSVTDVKVVNVAAKAITRGTRYPGMTNSYKKAIITIKEGEAIDLFKE